MNKKGITGPTWLTILRIILAIIFFSYLLQPEVWAKTIALIVFILAAVTDFLDGQWARRKKLVTNLGAFLDPLADKMLVNLALLALVYLGNVPVWVFAVILIRDFMVDGVRMAAAQNGKTIAASIFGKLKTVFQMAAIIVLILSLIIPTNTLHILGNSLIYAATLLSLVSGAEYLLKNKAVFINKAK